MTGRGCLLRKQVFARLASFIPSQNVFLWVARFWIWCCPFFWFWETFFLTPVFVCFWKVISLVSIIFLRFKSIFFMGGRVLNSGVPYFFSFEGRFSAALGFSGFQMRYFARSVICRSPNFGFQNQVFTNREKNTPAEPPNSNSGLPRFSNFEKRFFAVLVFLTFKTHNSLPYLFSSLRIAIFAIKILQIAEEHRLHSSWNARYIACTATLAMLLHWRILLSCALK